MGRLVKCKNESCGKRTDIDTMIIHELKSESGKRVVRKHFCDDRCFGEWKSNYDFIQLENKERDELDKIIKEIHGVPDGQQLPQNFWSMKIQALRNGSVMIGKRKKRYKEGFPFSLIADTYRFCKKDILKAKKTISFESLSNELSYGFAIVNDKIGFVKKRQDRIKAKQAQEEAREKKELEYVPIEAGVDIKFKRKKDDTDISDFLD